MNDRADKIAAVMAAAPKGLRDEIAYLTCDIGERDYAYDELSAVFDIEDRNEQSGGERALLNAARAALIAIGFYREMLEEEQRATQRSSGPVWCFKQGGVAYTSDETVDDWQWPHSTEQDSR